MNDKKRERERERESKKHKREREKRRNDRKRQERKRKRQRKLHGRNCTISRVPTMEYRGRSLWFKSMFVILDGTLLLCWPSFRLSGYVGTCAYAYVSNTRDFNASFSRFPLPSLLLLSHSAPGPLAPFFPLRVFCLSSSLSLSLSLSFF